MPDDMPVGNLRFREHKGKVFVEAKWRDSTRTQRQKRLGLAWAETSAAGEWVKKPGRVKPGFLDERGAYVAMAAVIDDHEAELSRAPGHRQEGTFDAAAASWLDHLQHEKRAKPNTLKEARIILATPSSPKQKGARIMRTFSGRKLADISSSDIQRFLAALDRQGLSARNTNRHRQTLHSIFNYAMRPDTFGLKANPVATTSKRPEAGAKQLDVFEPAEIEKIAEAARSGLHRSKPRGTLSDVTEAEWGRANDQDGDLYVVAFGTGLRQAELAALRWKDVETDQVNVSRAMSAGVETTTKSRQVRVVALSNQAKAAFERLKERENFTSREDHVFCTAAGAPLDRANVRKRFVKAQEAAGIHVRTFHDLRHSFGSMAVRVFDPITVQRLMGHADLQTTARYLHSRAREDEGAKLTAAFS